jgi:hypothetical protein
MESVISSAQTAPEVKIELSSGITCSYKPAPKGFGIIFISILTDKYKAVYISHKENTCKKTI